MTRENIPDSAKPEQPQGKTIQNIAFTAFRYKVSQTLFTNQSKKSQFKICSELGTERNEEPFR